MSGEYESPAPSTTPALREQFSRIGQNTARLESAATERRWADCEAACRELLSTVSKILQRVQVIRELQEEGQIPR